MRTESCHGPSGIVAQEEPVPQKAPTWSGNTRLGSLEGLGGEARKRVHENNLRIRYGDGERYAAYVEEYLRGVQLCRTVAEFQAYGPLAMPAQDDEPGSTIYERWEVYDGPWSAMARQWRAASGEAGALRLRLAGKPVPLDVTFDVSATAKLQYRGRAFGGTWSARRGAAPEVGVATRGVGVTVKGDGQTEAGIDALVAGAKVTMSGHGVEAVEVKARVLPGVSVYAKRTSGEIQHSLALGGTLGGANGAPGVQVEARASLSVTLLTSDLVREALFGNPFPEKKD